MDADRVSGCWNDKLDRALKRIGRTYPAALLTLGLRQRRAAELDPLLRLIWKCEADLREVERLAGGVR